MAKTAQDDEADNAAEDQPKKGGLMMPLIIGFVLALALGGGAAFSVASGMLSLPFMEDKHAAEGHEEEHKEKKPKEPPVFVEFEPLDLTIGGGTKAQQLRISFTIETTKEHQLHIENFKPRILDTINTLLRAMEPSDLNEPYALDRLRAQIARRIRVSIGPDSVHDILITQYIIL